MILRFLFFISILFFLVACNKTENQWVNNTILSEKNILIASSVNLKNLVNKSDLENSAKLSYEQKIIFDAFKSSFSSQYLGFDVEAPQKLFIVSNPNKFNAVAFLAGNVIDIDIFKESLRNFLAIDSFNLVNPTICFSDKYNLTVGFNSTNFLIGFSLDENFTKEKIINYFQSDSPNNSDVLLTKFLKQNDDFGFYISSANVLEFINNIKIPFIKSQITNTLDLDLLNEEFIFNMNFLPEKISCSSSFFSTVIKNKPVDVKYNNFIDQYDSLLFYGFANIELNKMDFLLKQLNRLSEGFQKDVLFLDFKEIISTLDGSISFSVNKPINPFTNLDSSSLLDEFSVGKETNSKVILDNMDNEWDDDEFFDNETVMPKLDNSLQFMLSLGIKEKQKLVNFCKKNNYKLSDGKVMNSKTYSYLLKNEVLHLTNNFKLLDKINIRVESEILSEHNQKHFQHSLYSVFDIETILKSYSGENYIKIDNEREEIAKLFTQLLVFFDGEELNMEFHLKEKNENAFKVLMESILYNEIIEDYL